jgi:hypothetical protein
MSPLSCVSLRRGRAGWIRTLNLKIGSPVLYHYATAADSKATTNVRCRSWWQRVFCSPSLISCQVQFDGSTHFGQKSIWPTDILSIYKLNSSFGRQVTFYTVLTRCLSQIMDQLYSGWKPTNLTSVFTLRTSVFSPLGTTLKAIDMDVKYRCLQMLHGLISSHPKLKLRGLNLGRVFNCRCGRPST